MCHSFPTTTCLVCGKKQLAVFSCTYNGVQFHPYAHLQDVPLNNERQPELQKGVIACCSAIHQSVERNSALYFEQLRRHNYVRCDPQPLLLLYCHHQFRRLHCSIASSGCAPNYWVHSSCFTHIHAAATYAHHTYPQLSTLKCFPLPGACI